MAHENPTITAGGATHFDESHEGGGVNENEVSQGSPDEPTTAVYERALLQPSDLRRRLKVVFSVIGVQQVDAFIDEIFEDVPDTVGDQKVLRLLDWQIGRNVLYAMGEWEAHEGRMEQRWPLPILTERKRSEFSKLLQKVWDSRISDHELPTVFSEYTILARGGFGVVLAPHVVDVALKSIDLSHGIYDSNLIRVQREEQSLSALEMDGAEAAPRLLARGTMQGSHIIAMDRVHGKTLQQTTRDADLQDDHEKCVCSLNGLKKLIHVHRQGMVHRDIKPGNMMRVTETGKVKIIDFGAVRTRKHDELDKKQDMIDQTCTLPGIEPIGTLQYMAPDQAINPSAFHPRNDQYAYGLSLYKMWTGDDPRPFFHQVLVNPQTQQSETAEEANARKIALLRSERFRENLPKLRQLPAEIAMVIELLLHRDRKFSDDPDWTQAQQRAERAQAMLEQFEIRGPSRLAPLRRQGSKMLTWMNAWKYWIAGSILAFGGVAYGVKKMVEPPPHLRVVEEAEPPHPQFTRLTVKTFATGVREPVILLPEDLEGKAWKFNRAVDFFVGDDYIGSEGVVEGEGVGMKGSVISTHLWDNAESVVKMGNGMCYHRHGGDTDLHHNLFEDEMDQAHVQRSRVFAHLTENNQRTVHFRTFFRRLQARTSMGKLTVKTPNPTLRNSVWGIDRTDEEFVEYFTKVIGRSTVPMKPELKSVRKKVALKPTPRDLDLAALQLRAPHVQLCTNEMRKVLKAHVTAVDRVTDPRVDPQVAAVDAAAKDFAVDQRRLAVVTPPEEIGRDVDTGKQGS